MDGGFSPRLLRPRGEKGKRKLLQKSISLGKCTRSEAKARRDELAVSIGAASSCSRRSGARGVAPHVVGRGVRSARRRTVVAYENVIAKHLTPALGSIQLQALRPGQSRNITRTRPQGTLRRDVARSTTRSTPR